MTLTKYAAPIGPRMVETISTREILEVLQPLWQRTPETAERLRGRIENVLDAAKAKGLRTGENPARWRGHLDQLLPKRQRLSRRHHTALPYVDVPAFMADLRGREACFPDHCGSRAGGEMSMRQTGEKHEYEGPSSGMLHALRLLEPWFSKDGVNSDGRAVRIMRPDPAYKDWNNQLQGIAVSVFASALANAEPVDAPEPLPLRRALPPAELFPLTALGPLLEAAARGIMDRVQCPFRHLSPAGSRIGCAENSICGTATGDQSGFARSG